LKAAIAEGQRFEVTLARNHTESYCTFYERGRGGDIDTEYTFDLHKPPFCRSPSCGFDLEHVDHIRISAPWHDRDLDPDGNTGRGSENETASVVISVGGIEFSKKEKDWYVSDTYGGAKAHGLCWRGIWHDPADDPEIRPSVKLDASGERVEATLTGPRHTTVRLVADLSDQPFNLVGCTRLVVQGTFPEENNVIEFLYADERGATVQYPWGESGPSELQVNLNRPPSDLFRYEPDAIATPPVTLSAVDQLAIGKKDDAVASKEPISITALQFCWGDFPDECTTPSEHQPGLCCKGILDEAQCTNGCVRSYEWTGNEVGSGEPIAFKCGFDTL
jgi:hypothetical protein